MSAWQADGKLTKAFGIENGINSTDNANTDTKKTASPDDRYPIKNKEQAERSMQRAKRKESPETFEKIAEKILAEYPELENEKLAGVGYQLGREFARGMIDELS